MSRTYQQLMWCRKVARPIKLKPASSRRWHEKLMLAFLDNWYRSTLANRYCASVPLLADIGPGLRLLHGFSGIFIVSSATIGARVTLHQHVTIGKTAHGSPVLGDDVYVGAGATIVGRTVIGNGAKIGAGVVLVDVEIEAGAVIVNASAYDVTNGRYVRDVSQRSKSAAVLPPAA